jgi:hypothetical protein
MLAELTAFADSLDRMGRDAALSALTDPRVLLQLPSWTHANHALELFEDDSRGVISLQQAPLAVLAALPGFSADVLVSIDEVRAGGHRYSNLRELIALLPEHAAAALLPHFNELAGMTQPSGDAWNVIVAVEPDGTGARLVIRAQLVRSGARVAILSRRSAVE